MENTAVMKIVTWIVVADGARAYIVENEGIGKGLRPVLTREIEPRLGAPTRDLGTDRPGRGFAGRSASRSGIRHAIEPHVDWHRFEKRQFADGIAKILSKAAQAKSFGRLVLVAPPETLGVLRAALSPAARKKVTAEVGKDLTAIAVHELAERLADVVNL